MNTRCWSAAIQAFLFCGLANLIAAQHDEPFNHTYPPGTGQVMNTSFPTEMKSSFPTEINTSLPTEIFIDYEPVFHSALDDVTNLSSALCQDLYSCSTSSDDPASPGRYTGCSCHNYCHLFGSCCRDKVTASTKRGVQPLPRDAYICSSSKLFTRAVYMVTSCPSSYDDLRVSLACSHEIDFDAPQADQLSTPVTDIVTGATYRNVYCARCWGLPTGQTATWLWKYSNEVRGDTDWMPAQTGGDAASEDGFPTDRPLPEAGDRREAALNFLRQNCSLQYAPPRELTSTTLQQCEEGIVDGCSDLVPVGDPRRIGCASGPVAYVYVDWSTYRNADCAACAVAGRLEVAEVRCKPPLIARSGAPSLSFSVILTPETESCVAAQGRPRSAAQRAAAELCTGDTGSGRLMPASRDRTGACPSGSRWENGVCRLANGTQTCAFPESLAAAAGVGVVDTYFVNTTLVALVNDTMALCFLCVVEQHTNVSETNGSLSVVVDGKLRRYYQPLYAVDGDRATVCVSLAVPSSSSAIGCSAVPDYVSAIALCLSEVCLILFAAAYALLKLMRRFPGEMVLNQCVAFFLAFLLFLLRPLADSSSSACTVLAVFIHYLLIAAFAWTAAYSAEIARALSFKVSEGPPIRRRVLYYVIGWGAPLACIAVGNIADAYDLPFRPRYGGLSCFIDSRFGNLILFMAPLCVFLSIDVAVYGFMVVRLAVIARQTKMARSSHNEKLWLSVKLIFTMGLLWIVAVLASFTGSEVLYCVFSLLNALQGVFTFVVFVCKRVTLAALRQRVSHSTKSEPSRYSATTQSVLPSTTPSSALPKLPRIVRL